MTTSRTSRLLLVGACGAALALAMPAAAGAADWPAPKTSQDGASTVIKVHAVEIEDGDDGSDEGEDSEEEGEEQAPKVGESFSFEENLTQDGVAVGKDKITCTVTKVTATAGVLRCEGDWIFAPGSVRISDSLEFPLKDEETEPPFDVAIVSGTGAYAGAKGKAHIVNNPDDSSDVTLTFTPGAPGQVSDVPVGGAETGAGYAAATDGRLDGTGLIALGGVMAAAGAGLLGANRRAARNR